MYDNPAYPTCSYSLRVVLCVRYGCWVDIGYLYIMVCVLYFRLLWVVMVCGYGIWCLWFVCISFEKVSKLNDLLFLDRKYRVYGYRVNLICFRAITAIFCLSDIVGIKNISLGNSFLERYFFALKS